MSGDRKSLILVVDDEESICLLYQAELEDGGYEVHIETEGEKVLNDVASLHPDLVVLDIKMPRVNGLDLLAQIKNRYPEVRVVINSAYGSLQKEEVIQLADGFVVKSSDLTDLLQSVRNALT